MCNPNNKGPYPGKWDHIYNAVKEKPEKKNMEKKREAKKRKK